MRNEASKIEYEAAKKQEPVKYLPSSFDGRYINIICPKCGKAKVISYKLALKDFECTECKGLDTLERKTGFRGYLKNPANLKKLDDACIKKLGVKRPFMDKKVQEKVNISLYDKNLGRRRNQGFIDKDTMLKKYGVENIMELSEYRAKIIDSLSKRKDSYYNTKIDENFDFSKLNKLELAFYKSLQSVYNNLIYAERRALGYMELDFFNPILNEGYEIGSWWWHTVDNKGKQYHKRKYTLGISKNISIFQFFDIDFYKVRDVLLSYMCKDFNRSYTIEEGDLAEFNYFNLSFKEMTGIKCIKILDNLGGRYIAIINNNFVYVAATNEVGTIYGVLRYLNLYYNVLVDNRLTPIIDDKAINFISFKDFSKAKVEDAGYKLYKKGELNNAY